MLKSQNGKKERGTLLSELQPCIINVRFMLPIPLCRFEFHYVASLSVSFFEASLQRELAVLSFVCHSDSIVSATFGEG